MDVVVALTFVAMSVVAIVGSVILGGFYVAYLGFGLYVLIRDEIRDH